MCLSCFSTPLSVSHLEGGGKCCQPDHPYMLVSMRACLQFLCPYAFQLVNQLIKSKRTSEGHLEGQGRLRGAAASIDVGNQSYLWLYFMLVPHVTGATEQRYAIYPSVSSHLKGQGRLQCAPSSAGGGGGGGGCAPAPGPAVKQVVELQIPAVAADRPPDRAGRPGLLSVDRQRLQIRSCFFTKAVDCGSVTLGDKWT